MTRCLIVPKRKAVLRDPETPAEGRCPALAALRPPVRRERPSQARKSRLRPGPPLANGRDDLRHRVQAIASRHPLGELDHVQPAFLRLDLGDEGLRLVQPFGQVRLGQPCINTHLPEPLAKVNVFRGAKGLGQVTAC